MWDETELSYAKQASVLWEETHQHRRLKNRAFGMLNDSEKNIACNLNKFMYVCMHIGF